MKYHASLLALCLWACSGTRAPQQAAPSPANPVDTARVDTTGKIAEALEDLEIAVKKHDKKGIVALLDPEYRYKEHDDRFQGNTDQFLNEVFCGQVLHSEQRYCLVFDEITDFKRVYLEAKPGSLDAAYDVKTPKLEIRVHMKSALNSHGGLVGFIGPKGITQVEKGYK